MSQFHNSRWWERIALAWHVLGVFISLVGFVSAIAAMGIIFAVRGLIVSFLPEIYLVYVWTGFLALVIWGAGILFHIWAALQHVDHMKALRHEPD